MKILVIDDQMMLERERYQYFRDRGHTVLVDNLLHSDFARLTAEVRVCDVFILDLMMDQNHLFDGDTFEGETGTEILRRLRDKGYTKPVVVVTRKSVSNELRQELKNLGVDHVVPRTTISADELLALLVAVSAGAKRPS